MDRRHLMAGGAAGAAVLATPNLASAQPRLRWRCPGSYPKSVDTQWACHELFCRRVGELTDGAFQLLPFGPGEIGPGLQVMDAIGQGSVECGFTPALFYYGKDPALAFGTAVPFGLSSRQTWSWLHQAGGREVMRDVYRDQGVHAIPANNTGAQMGGWFRREVRTVDDMKGLKMRIAGIAGNVMQKLGVVPQQIAGGDIYPALERGTLDAAEFVGPYDDEKLGFHKVAKYYYYPGFWEGGAMLHLVVNLEQWNRLPKTYQAILNHACEAANNWMLAKYDAVNAPALRRLIANGAELRGFSTAIMDAAYTAASELYAEVAAKNPLFKRAYDSMVAFRGEQYLWWQVSEYTFDNFMIRARARG